MRNAASFPRRWVPAVSCKNADFLEQRKLGILFDCDVDHHKALRLAILPLMHSEKLALLAPAMNHSTAKLCQLLEKAADAGRTDDIHKMLGSLTLDVISSVVCGKDMGALDADLAERHLSTASDCASVFEHFEPVSGGGTGERCLRSRDDGHTVSFTPAFAPPLEVVALSRGGHPGGG